MCKPLEQFPHKDQIIARAFLYSDSILSLLCLTFPAPVTKIKHLHCCRDYMQEFPFSKQHFLFSKEKKAKTTKLYPICEHHPSLHSASHTTVPAKVSLQEWPRHLPQSSGQCFLLLWWWGVWGRNPRKAAALSLSDSLSSMSVRPLQRPQRCRTGLNHSHRGRSNHTAASYCSHCSHPAGCRWSRDLFLSCVSTSDGAWWIWWRRWTTSSHDHSWIVLREKSKTKREIF